MRTATGGTTPRSTPPSGRVRSVALVVLAVTALLVTACGDQDEPPPDPSVSMPGYGVSRYAYPVRILNALVFPAAPPERPDPVLTAGVANDGEEPDQLAGIDLIDRDGRPVPGRVEIVGARDIPAGGLLLVSTAASSTVAYVCGANYPPEGTVGLRFRFARAAPADVATVVAPAGGYSGRGLSLRLPRQLTVPPCP